MIILRLLALLADFLLAPLAVVGGAIAMLTVWLTIVATGKEDVP